MKRFITLLLIALIFSTALFVPAFAQSSTGVKEEYLNENRWLTLSKNKTGARYFVDKGGNPVNLFGMARCQYHAEDEDRIYSKGASSVDSLVEHYASYGANIMRLAIDMPELCGGEKRTAEEINTFITKYIDPDVQAIIRNGLYVMLDVHMYPPASCKTPKGITQYAEDYYIPVWKELAKKYKDEPMVAVYEIWNEPYPADREQLSPDKKIGWNEAVRDFYLKAVAEIRKIDKKHVILVSDWNAGWGAAMPETWGGNWDKVDPVYQNTAFSVHCTNQQLEVEYGWYSNWWKSIARDNNICIIFGEIETEYDISTEKGMWNLCDFLDKTEKDYHFSGVMWRPHGQKWEYHNVWADTGWLDKYCNTSPTPTARYAIDVENVLGQKSEKVEVSFNTTLFGTKNHGSGISMKPKLKKDEFYETSVEVRDNIVYKEGSYKLVVRAAGKEGYTGDFIVGYKDIDGVVHQVARFSGYDTKQEPYYQSIDFTSNKKIVSFVIFGCEDKEKSVVIDRLYIEGKASENEVASRLDYEIPNSKKIIYLNGEDSKVNVEPPKQNITVNNSSSGGNIGSSGDDTFFYEGDGSDKENNKTDKENGKNSNKDKNNSNKVENSESNAIEEENSAAASDDFSFPELVSGAKSNSLTLVVAIVLGIILLAVIIIVVLSIISKVNSKKE